MSTRLGAVYPRLRGGSQNRRPRVKGWGGLSPPTRGIRVDGHHAGNPYGSIPAYAGDPGVFKPPPVAKPVYPRLRGGSTAAPSTALRLGGLSPPTRGIRWRFGQRHHCGWSIPAYAGDPPPRVCGGNAARVYPRLRGGSHMNRRRRHHTRGLSPPTRGIRLRTNQVRP